MAATQSADKDKVGGEQMRSDTTIRGFCVRVATVGVLVALLSTVIAFAATGARAVPVKLLPVSRFGAEVDATTKANICTVASHDTCQSGKNSTIAGGYNSEEGVAVNTKTGDVYVADLENRRVQELSSTGEFILMFGWEVNETKDKEPLAIPEERNVCAAVSKDKCKTGVSGALAEKIAGGAGLTVDPTTGNVYVEDSFNSRVEEYTATGDFILMFGKEVNETTKANICTKQEIVNNAVKCKAGVAGEVGGAEHSAFKFRPRAGNLLTVGAKDTLYVGDEHRVQKFESDGDWVGELLLTSIAPEQESDVSALTADTSGDLFLVYRQIYERGEVVERANVVREFDPEGNEVGRFTVGPKVVGALVLVNGIALGPSGEIAVSVEEQQRNHPPQYSGFLFEGMSGHLISTFSLVSSDALDFDAGGELYAAASRGNEVVQYAPVSVGELAADPSGCKVEGESEALVTLECTLKGEVNSEDVPETKVWFEWGSSPEVGEKTPVEPIATGLVAVPVTATVKGLEPNTPLYDQLVGEDREVKTPEQLISVLVARDTPVVPPKIVGSPIASFVGDSSAVLFGEFNPENATTIAEFQYGPCADLDVCASLKATETRESGIYGTIGTTVEATELQPDTTYHYRLIANNSKEVEGKPEGGQVVGEERSFTTSPRLKIEATTVAAVGITATTSTIVGTVNPGAQVATYAFELGTGNGVGAYYGTMVSGTVEAATKPITEAFAVTGLQPGAEYVFRITAHSGDQTATGVPVTFRTGPVEPVIFAPVLAEQLPVPAVSFPKTANTKKIKRPAKKVKKHARKAGKRNAHHKRNRNGRVQRK
jgi:hypothetical protein